MPASPAPAALTPDTSHLAPVSPDSLLPASAAPPNRRREAALRNLEKARAAPRSLIYRPTERRLTACRANITKAAEWHRTTRNPSYAPGFRHGAQFQDLERSLEAAGETAEDYACHRQDFQQGFRPRTAVESNLVDGAAQAVWRRLRVLRTHHATELLRLCALLLGLRAATASVRRQHFARDVRHKLGAAVRLWAPLQKLHQRLERIFRVLVEPETGEFEFGLARRSPALEESLASRPASAIGNPWSYPRQLQRAACPVNVRPPDEWRAWGAGNPAYRGWYGKGFETDEQKEWKLRQGLRAQAREIGRMALPETLEEFTRLVEAKLGEGAPDGSAAPDEELRKLARLLWERVTLWTRRAEEEAQKLEALLTAAAAAAPLDAEARRKLAAQVLSLMLQVDETMEEAEEMEERIERAARDYAEGRPINTAPPTRDERLAKVSATELIQKLLEAHLAERTGQPFDPVKTKELIRQQKKTGTSDE